MTSGVYKHKKCNKCATPHIWDCQKVLVSSKTILELYWGGDVEIKEKQREMGNKLLHRDAIYLRKKQVLLMPRCCLCPTIYGTLYEILTEVKGIKGAGPQLCIWAGSPLKSHYHGDNPPPVPPAPPRCLLSTN